MPVLAAVWLALVGGCHEQSGKAETRSGGSEQSRASSPDENHPSASGSANKTAVKILYPRPGGIKRTTTQPGSIQAFEAVSLYAKVSGYLQNQQVDIGDLVRQGETLAEVEAPELRSAANKAKADVQKSHTMVEQAKATLVARQSDLKASRARRDHAEFAVKALQATVTLRKKQYDRIDALAKLNAIQFELVDEQAQKLESAKADELAGEKAVVAADAEVGAADAAVAEAKAALSNAEASVAVSEALLNEALAYVEFMSIKAPFNGVITNRNYFNDDFVRSAVAGGNVPEISKPVLRVARRDKMRVVVELPDRDVLDAQAGNAATVTVDTLPHHKFPGTVSRTSRSEKYGSRTMRTEVDLLNPDGVLEDGMYGDVTIYLQSSDQGVTIPSSCLFGKEEDGKRSVYVVVDGQARLRKVTIGIDTGVEAQITDGLSAHDEVVVEHDAGLVDHAAVAVTGTIGMKAAEKVAKSHDEKHGGKGGGDSKGAENESQGKGAP
jgi:RND family efflux transporter MFP subunit